MGGEDGGDRELDPEGGGNHIVQLICKSCREMIGISHCRVIVVREICLLWQNCQCCPPDDVSNALLWFDIVQGTQSCLLPFWIRDGFPCILRPMKTLIDYPNNDHEVHRQVVIKIHAFSCFKLDHWSDHHSLEMGSQMDICHQSIMFVLVWLELTWHFIRLSLNGFVQFLHCNQIDIQVLSSVWELKCGGLCYRVLHSRTCFRYYVCTVSLHLEEYLLHFWYNNIHSFHNILCSSTVQIQEWICGCLSKIEERKQLITWVMASKEYFTGGPK